MRQILPPILSPVKGSSDISVSFSDASHSFYAVFIGLAFLEKVPAAINHPSFKMFLGRLFNAGFSARLLESLFGVSRTSIVRWGAALKSDDMERIKTAFSGQGARKKITQSIACYIKDRYLELKGIEKNYNVLIRGEVKKYFNEHISSESARKIFLEVREEQRIQNKNRAGVECTGFSESQELFDTHEDPNGCEKEAQPPAIETFLESSRKYSCQTVLQRFSLREGQSVYCHHAGLLLLRHRMEEVFYENQEQLDRQTVAQILLGAVNHEQAKKINFSSLEMLIGSVITNIDYQRKKMDALATPENTFRLQSQNVRFLQANCKTIFYFDPHTSDYTGILPVLKGWCGGKHTIEKITNLDFIHDNEGNPCYVEHADNYYEMRHRFFFCAQRFHRTLPAPENSITWVIDRGIYGLNALREIVKQGDNIITWEKNYKADGWNENSFIGKTSFFIERNNAQDKQFYRFEYQEIPWERDRTFRKFIVRATNPKNKKIEVSILCSNKDLSAHTIIYAIFRRWLQENDFGYMDRHVGINEMTSRAYQLYEAINDTLTDRLAPARKYKARKKEKTKLEEKLKTNLLKRRKLVKSHLKKRREEEAAIIKNEQHIQQLQQEEASKSRDKELKRAQTKQTQIERKQIKNKTNRATATKKLKSQMSEQTSKIETLEKTLDTLYREESRLEILVDENNVRLDFRRKAYMDALRIISRNIFYSHLRDFRPLYNNYRDDHVIIRHLTQSPGIIENCGGTLYVSLLPSMEFSKKKQKVINEYLLKINEQINQSHSKTDQLITLRIHETGIDKFKIRV